jgi:hypothetical protein
MIRITFDALRIRTPQFRTLLGLLALLPYALDSCIRPRILNFGKP